MMYLSATDYFFWQGIFHGVYSIVNEDEIGPSLNTETNNACLESYMDGFTIGLEMNVDEYHELTNG